VSRSSEVNLELSISREVSIEVKNKARVLLELTRIIPEVRKMRFRSSEVQSKVE